MADTATLKLEKYHGQGNDFLILIDADDSRLLGAGAVRALCDRHKGVGADGVIRTTIDESGPTMELWNADGSRAEMSGNGIRCLALALADSGLVSGPDIEITTDAGLRKVHLDGDGATVEMGEVVVTTGENGALFVDVGNPHAVLEVQDPYDHDLGREARRFRGRNLELVSAGPGPGEITMRVWERGVGETMACGTGSCAAAAAALKWGFGFDRTVVRQPGGSVIVGLTDGHATLTGSVRRIASIEVPWP